MVTSSMGQPGDGTPLLGVSDFVAITNQVLERAYPSVLIEGEVESFRVSQQKFVFFNLKDEAASIGCFMMAFQLRLPVTDGMRVVVRARPKLTQWGKFSLTIESIRPLGEGSLQKSFAMLQARLAAEGLFAPEGKRPLPAAVRRVAVISSRESAGYADFMKIANQRWGGVEFLSYHTAVQGETAPAQMVRAIEYLNQQEPLADVLVLVRGGGSLDDLAAFNDEALVRAIAASRIPTLVGVGHEVDTTLADQAADVRAATPTHAATMLVPDRQAVAAQVAMLQARVKPLLLQTIIAQRQAVQTAKGQAWQSLQAQLVAARQAVVALERLAASFDPDTLLARGYALVRQAPATMQAGAYIELETAQYNITAKVVTYDKK